MPNYYMLTIITTHLIVASAMLVEFNKDYKINSSTNELQLVAIRGASTVVFSALQKLLP